eukprot:m.101793 g.101793  ORF g.101793 m.101793 type:complete len:430 (-) comp8976_c0_seq6:88-1377(-)
MVSASVAALLVAAAAALCTWVFSTPSIPAWGALDSTLWDAEATSFARLVESALPVLLAAPPSSQWPCHRIWTFEHLETALPAVDTKFIRQLNDEDVEIAEFRYFNEERPMTDRAFLELFNLTANRGFERALMTAPGFFAALQGLDRPSHRRRVQSSAPLREAFPPSECSLVGSWPGLDTSEPNLWLAGAQTASTGHYDTSDNIYVPILGKKTFYVGPPEINEQLGLYPVLHQHYRQTQAVFPAVPRPDVLEITVEPGQALFLPAYWWHYVRTDEPSVALNFWTTSVHFESMEIAFASPVPLEPDWEAPLLHLATRVYLRDMILAAAGVREKDFVLRKVLPRYAFLPEPARDPEALLGKIHCNDSLAASLQVAELSNSMATRVASNAQYFQHLPVAIRDIYLASYIESVVYRVVGIERTYTFLHRCLDFS